MPAKKSAAKSAKTTAKSKPAVLASQPKPTTAAAKPSDDRVLVCLQDPFASGVWSLLTTATVPAADGQAAHQWQITAGFELLPPRFLEGQASRQPITLALKGFFQAAPAGNAAWASAVRAETDPVNPLRLMVRLNAAGKVELSLAFGAKHAGEMQVKATADKRWFNGDVAFAENGDTGLTVGAVAAISALPWALLVGGSNAAIKGLAFDGGWRKNLEEGPKPVADGACSTTGSWGFAMMTTSEYESWCAATGRVPRIV